MKPHILMTSSIDKLFYVETFIRSLEIYESGSYFLSLILTDMNSTFEGEEDHKLEQKLAKQFPVIWSHAEISFSYESFRTHPPVRWSIRPKSEICLFIDSDILVCSPIKSLIDLCIKEERLCGVIAHKSHIRLKEWKKLYSMCGVPLESQLLIKTRDNNTSPFYINYGVVAVPKFYFEKISVVLPEIIKVVNANTTKPFFTGQIALSIAIAKCKVPTLPLSLRFNYPDNPCYDEAEPEELSNIVFYHMLQIKYSIQNIKDAVRFINSSSKIANHKVAKKILSQSFLISASQIYL